MEDINRSCHSHDGCAVNYHDNAEHSSHVNKCICCDVKHCYYHDNSNYCTADKINVGPTSAHSSAETICVTFKPKDE